MRVSVFGLGYVGIVSAACLARDGHKVVGVDPQAQKVERINAGNAPIIESYVEELVGDAVKGGRAARHHLGRGGGGGLRYEPRLRRHAVAAQRLARYHRGGAGLRGDRRGASRAKGAPHLVVIRSTILPGTMRGLVIPTLERRRRHGGRRGAAAWRTTRSSCARSRAVYDYDNPPKTVVGRRRPAGGGGGAGALRGAAGAEDRRPPRGGRDGEIRRQYLARGQGRLRQRDRQHRQGSSGVDS